jgi:hypothetical protein
MKIIKAADRGRLLIYKLNVLYCTIQTVYTPLISANEINFTVCMRTFKYLHLPQEIHLYLPNIKVFEKILSCKLRHLKSLKPTYMHIARILCIEIIEFILIFLLKKYSVI